MTAGMFVMMSPIRTRGSVAAGKGTRKTGKQDRRRRHASAAKGLSAHGFARHGRAGGKCCDAAQTPMDQGTFGCHVLSGALAYARCLP